MEPDTIFCLEISMITDSKLSFSHELGNGLGTIGTKRDLLKEIFFYGGC